MSALHGRAPSPIVRAEAIPLTMDNADPEMLDALVERVGTVAANGQFVGDPEVAAFEAEFARYCDVPEAVGAASGTDALIQGLRALGVTLDDEPAPVATRLAGRICSLPIFPGLSSAAAERIAEVVRSVHS